MKILSAIWQAFLITSIISLAVGLFGVSSIIILENFGLIGYCIFGFLLLFGIVAVDIYYKKDGA